MAGSCNWKIYLDILASIRRVIGRCLLEFSLIRYRLHKPTNELVIVTGANYSHYASLHQFLESVITFEPNTKTYVFDLGLRTEQLQAINQLGSRLKQLSVLKFNYDRYPKFFNIDVQAGQYAWKPAIVKEIAELEKCSVLWCDAGNVVIKNLAVIRKIISKDGFFSPYSQGTVQMWTHQGMLEFLGTTAANMDKRNLNGALIGFNPNHSLTSRLIQEWYQCALTEECISPFGSSRKNHRQDQAALTNIAYKIGIAKIGKSLRIGDNVAAVGFRLHCDID